MKLTYRGPFRDGVVISVPGVPELHASPGEVVEVPDDLGRSLLEQPDNWAAAKGAAAKKED